MTASPSANLIQRTYDVAIVGNDMLLAALPARPVQVIHAVQASGFDLVVPVSWGEEVLADHAMRRLAENGPRPMVLCTCPRVRARLLQSGNELTPHVISTVAPPVATARYLHALHPQQRLRITYLGACDGARDPAIAVQVSPLNFLRSLQERGIVITQQPTIFDSVVPPDRRRHWSQAGGAPTRQALVDRGLGHQLAVLVEEEVSARIADHLLMGEEVLMDLAPRMGCACAGSITVHHTVASREALVALEPPRSLLPVIESELRIDVEHPMPHLESSPGAPRPTLRLEPPTPALAPPRIAAGRSAPMRVAPVVPLRLSDAPMAMPGVRPPLAVTPPGVSDPAGSDESGGEPRPTAPPPVELRKLSAAPRPPQRPAEATPAPPPAEEPVAPPGTVRRRSPAFGVQHVARAGRGDNLSRAASAALRSHRHSTSPFAPPVAASIAEPSAAPTPEHSDTPSPTTPEQPPGPGSTDTPASQRGVPDAAADAPSSHMATQPVPRSQENEPVEAPPGPREMSPATASTIPGLFRPPEPPAEVEMVELQPAIAPVVTPPQGVTAIRPSASGDERGGRIITPPRSVPALSPPAPLKDPTAGVSPSASGSPPFRLPPVPESAPGARAPKPTPKKPARSPDGAAGQRAKLWGLLASIIAIAALTIVLKLVFDS